MKVITRNHLAERAANATGISFEDCYPIVNATIAAIVAELEQGNTISLRRFGSFTVRRKAGRQVSPHFAPDEIFEIPPRMAIRFKPAPSLKYQVAKIAMAPP